MENNIKTASLVNIKKGADLIRSGFLVAFPTETVYGLGANGLDDKAVRKIYEAKKRPKDNPLILHVADKNDLWKYGKKIPSSARKLVDKFWPGPLSLIVLKKKIVSDVVTAGLDAVALRMPDNEIALKLIKYANVPIAAPSANSFGKPSPTKAIHVYEDLKDSVECILDGGSTVIGLESTVLDLTTKIPIILRPGGITRDQIEKVIGKVDTYLMIKNVKKKDCVIKSPGMKYKHYSPKANVIIIDTKDNSKINKFINELKRKKLKFVVLDFKNNEKLYGKCEFMSMGNNLNTYAKRMFDYFRVSDLNGFDIILIRAVLKDGLGVAIMNRLEKAAKKTIK